MKNFPFGDIVTNPPPTVAPPESWPEFGDIAYVPKFCSKESVGTEPQGVRWAVWPLCFEQYYSDTEPDLAASNGGALARNREVIWKRILRTDVPAGWKVRSAHPWRIDGFVVVTPEYKEQWKDDARRNLATWKKKYLGTKYQIDELTLDEFVAAYKKSITRKKIGLDLLNALVRKFDLPEVRPHFTLWGVRDVETKEIVAGTAVFYSARRDATVRECPFILPEARKSYAMTGLMDHWFAESLRRGISTHLFTHFWHPGASKGWVGFSEFKSHFGLQYVAYPPELSRFVRGKLF